ncbi:MAG TPA: 2-succinyl-5-enolpyruvyl-6-hydroxy-3-cyclohexene-1-carboxylic-acid synthase [Solirubrobacteraceae bacterium]|nr:2-succinyl-5-enolpyruvyl-6-hydroxy-3-cyclohexene-1-carboxylic-acid synthase [Solirubrobacteraceae bacterium]
MTATDIYLLLRAFCEELGRCGLRHACTSPGSRGTPLLLSLVREPRIRCWSHIDERCAGFFAVGAAKASGRPVAITCTSGTAAANYLPAVVEAHHGRVPLIVLTADRPPELREVGAGQAIDQIKLYGDAVKWFFEVGVDRATEDSLRWMRQLACRAYWTASAGRPGPVHLNFPLREPLVLDEPLSGDPVPGRSDGRPWTRFVSTPPVPSATAPDLPARGVVVAGRDERGDDLGDAVREFAEAAGYPLLADPLSGARSGPAAIATYDLLLRDDAFCARTRPELVVRCGDLPTSKPLRAWLHSLGDDVTQVALDPEAAWQDPAGVLGEVLAADPVSTLRAWTPPAPLDSDWLPGWRQADDAVTDVVHRELGPELSEPLVARLLGEALPEAATLVVASSMPIRDVELYLGGDHHLGRVLSNRGANGIDGTVSTAFGVAAASDAPVVLLIGDVALAHDIGGLIAARRLDLELTIVLLNNDGGGIFHFLAVSGETDAFEQHVATPHGLDFEHAARLYGLAYERVSVEDELRAALRAEHEPGQSRLIEVRTDRLDNLALHRRVADEALRALRELSPPAPAASPGA